MKHLYNLLNKFIKMEMIVDLLCHTNLQQIWNNQIEDI